MIDVKKFNSPRTWATVYVLLNHFNNSVFQTYELYNHTYMNNMKHMLAAGWMDNANPWVFPLFPPDRLLSSFAYNPLQATSANFGETRTSMQTISQPVFPWMKMGGKLRVSGPVCRDFPADFTHSNDVIKQNKHMGHFNFVVASLVARGNDRQKGVKGHTLFRCLSASSGGLYMAVAAGRNMATSRCLWDRATAVDCNFWFIYDCVPGERNTRRSDGWSWATSDDETVLMGTSVGQISVLQVPTCHWLFVVSCNFKTRTHTRIG